MKKLKKRKTFYTKQKKVKKLFCGDLILIDVIETVLYKISKYHSYYINIYDLYILFNNRKKYYNIDKKTFTKIVKTIFPKYNNKHKKTIILKLSQKHIDKQIKTYCSYINFKYVKDLL